MHILWINEVARMTGGCERYIAETVVHLRSRGIRSTLLYGVEGETEYAFTNLFDGAFPMVDIGRQIADIDPDLLYVHRLSDPGNLHAVTRSRVPKVRFFHDHKLFCLREHKYTAIGHRTCTRPVGAGCYSCLGFITKSQGFPGVAVRSVASLQHEQATNRAFDAFVVGSRYMRDEIVAHGFDPGRISVNPLYAAPAEPAPILHREHDLLLFAGQMTTGKGVDTLLHALTIARSAPRLILSGSGKFERAYRQLSENLSLADRVTFLGSQDSAALNALYGRAACVVVPSRTPETFGLIGPEAMRLGTPIIATSVGGMNEWLTPEETGLAVPPNDEHALAGAIDRMITDHAMRRRMGVAARVAYDAEFRPERHIERLLQFFSDMGTTGVDKKGFSH